MKKFIVTYHAPAAALAESQNTPPEEREKSMQQWYAWKEKCGDKLVDFGAPLMGGQTVNFNKDINPSKREVCGYSIMQAENIDDVKALLTDHPHLNWTDGVEIDVHEAMDMPK